MGLDPTLGLMHTDQRYRASLATDLMEPARPVADGIAIDLLSRRRLQRGEVYETREGTCRLGAGLTRVLTAQSETLGRAVAPYAEQLARALSGKADHPTPLTRRRHRAAVARPLPDARS